jgi:molybdenum cofactor cytidylyltransferase
MQRDCSVLILAAGFSSRMGKPKWLLELINGMTFLENLLIQFSSFGCRELAIVMNEKGIELLHQTNFKEKYPLKISLNKYPEKERFYSIQCGLKQIESDYVFIQNADHPFADLDLLKLLYKYRNEADYVKPVFENRGGHPILISRKVVDEIISLNIEEPQLKSVVNEDENLLFQNQFSSFLPHPQRENADNWCFFAPLGVRGNRKKQPIHNGSFKTFLQGFSCKKLEVNKDEILSNINTESDYLRLLHEAKTK